MLVSASLINSSRDLLGPPPANEATVMPAYLYTPQPILTPQNTTLIGFIGATASPTQLVVAGVATLAATAIEVGALEDVTGVPPARLGLWALPTGAGVASVLPVDAALFGGGLFAGGASSLRLI